MERVKHLSNYDDLIVRPMCAKLLEPSLPEREGWVNREKLLDINGRNRQRQLDMAKEIGLKDFESPGGGCLLTEVQFSNRLKDFVDHDKLEVEDIDTLKAGRHLRLPDGAKVIIGRNQEDNEKLKNTVSKKYYKVRILNAVGPLSLFEKKASQEDKELAASIILTYGKTQADTDYEVSFYDDNEEFIIKAKKLSSKDEISQYFI
jgi:tRNA-specific 2-thiouridylase